MPCSWFPECTSACKKTDLIIIHTEWDEFKTIDFKKVSKNKNVKIYDMRNLYPSAKMKKLGIVALLLSLSACGSVGGYSLNPMDYLGGSSDVEAEASE